MANFGSPSKLLTDNGPQCLSRFFVDVLSTLWKSNITSTEYYPQRNDQAERSSFRIVLRVGDSLSKPQTEWDAYLLPLTYAYSIQAHGSIEVSPFSLVLTQTPSGPPILVPKRPSLATHDEVTSALFYRLAVIRMTTSLRNKANNNFNLAQNTYRHHYDRHNLFVLIFHEGDEILLYRPSPFRSGIERSAAAKYTKPLPKLQGS